MVISLAFCRSKGIRKYNAIEKWNTQLKTIYQTVSNRVS
jgi:COP9 signalosome complex subunit 2